MILKNRVDNIQADFVKNASQNPTIPCRTVLADSANVLQSDSLTAATSMANMNTLKQRIYRARRKEQGEEKIPTSVESWNARWNRSMGTNHNVARIIKGFMNEDSLARAKLQEIVSGRESSANSSRDA